MQDMGGPFTCVNELEACMSTESPQKLKAILRTELSFRKHTSHRDYLARSYLYKVNQITETEMKVNLTLLLSNDADIETLPDLPSEDDMVNAFHLQETEKDTGQSTSQRESDQARIQGGGARRARAPPLLRQKKKRGEKGKGKKRKRKGERERETFRCHNLFFCAYIGLH